jgi:hypothetical protein
VRCGVRWVRACMQRASTGGGLEPQQILFPPQTAPESNGRVHHLTPQNLCLLPPPKALKQALGAFKV